MQTWDAITSRRNVRSFADRPIPAAELDQILEAGRRAPSSQNWQPWDFIVVTDREQLRELARVWRGAGHVAGSAATIVVIGPAADNEFGRAQFDLGQATMAMLLAAADLGIGSCHAGVADLRLARELLGFPEDRGWALLHLARLPLRPAADPDPQARPAAVRRGRAPRRLVSRQPAQAPTAQARAAWRGSGPWPRRSPRPGRSHRAAPRPGTPPPGRGGRPGRGR